MPTYEYKCHNCGYTFEEFQSIVAEPIKVCPICKKCTVDRLINGGIGLIFKGSGFYLTDYKRKENSTNSKSSVPEKKTTEKVTSNE